MSGPPPELFLARDSETPLLLPFAGGAAAVFTRRCPDKPTANEDAVALVPAGERSGALIVADGVGGERGGELAAALACRSIQEAVCEAGPDVHLRAAILDGIDRANRAIIELGMGAATTLAVVEVNDEIVRPYHVGDAMILLVGQRGRLKWQTVPHSPVGYAVESGLLDELEAMQHADRHLVSNIVGHADMRIEIGPERRLATRDTLLLASDGLSDNLSVFEIAEIIRCGPLIKRAGALASAAQSRMQGDARAHPAKPDDMSFVLYAPRRV